MQPVEICRVPPSRLRYILRFEDRRIPTGAGIKPDRYRTAYTSLPQTNGGAEGRRYCQLLQHGCFPPHDARSRICCRKSRYLQFHSFHATEVAKKFGEGIRVNAIAPGFFLTEQNRALLTNPDGSYTERGQDVIRQTPFGRMGRAEELCGTIQYLISDASSFVTGTVAVVDGGFNAFAM